MYKRQVVLLPGPPFEMKPMFEEYVIPLIKEKYHDLEPIKYLNLNIVGLPEATVAEAVRDLMEKMCIRDRPIAGL